MCNWSCLHPTNCPRHSLSAVDVIINNLMLLVAVNFAFFPLLCFDLFVRVPSTSQRVCLRRRRREVPSWGPHREESESGRNKKRHVITWKWLNRNDPDCYPELWWEAEESDSIMYKTLVYCLLSIHPVIWYDREITWSQLKVDVWLSCKKKFIFMWWNWEIIAGGF